MRSLKRFWRAEVDPEHYLLALLEAGDGITPQILKELSGLVELRLFSEQELKTIIIRCYRRRFFASIPAILWWCSSCEWSWTDKGLSPRFYPVGFSSVVR